MSPRSKCKNDPNSFCYICGYYTFVRDRRNITEFIEYAYKAYFGLTLGDQDKQWAPHTVCHNCGEKLRNWTKGKYYGLPFATPMTWREQKDHTTDCYFCLVNTKGHTKKTKHKISYPSIPSAIPPIPHSDQLPIPIFKGFDSATASNEPFMPLMEIKQEKDIECNFSYIQSPQNAQKMTQMELNDLVRDLGLSKSGAELLASRLQEHSLLDSTTKVSYYRRREHSDKRT
eukprot:TRINITY_DN499_c0_g5_i3.p1 TRINITY_DN499_c0_g5~~TRINITY_DN499_c0_g5_i3.p1  ORF type:complete len:229 (+),score=-11.64 TRINITY_DN499_c0_g5_i3:313-999(+)